MAVITVDETKVFLQIASSDSSKDDLIEALIPEIEANIKEYCNQAFATWPAGIKLVASKMIGYTMSIMAGGGGSLGMQSESQGEYSYSRGQNEATGEYPAEILASLNKWKITRAKFGTIMQQSRDFRGQPVEELAEGEYLNGINGVTLED